MNKDEGMFKDWGTGRKDTRAPTDFYQVGTEQGDFYQYEDDKDVSTTAKLRKVGEEVITKRHPQHKVRTKGMYEAGGTGRQDTRAATDFYQAGTKQVRTRLGEWGVRVRTRPGVRGVMTKAKTVTRPTPRARARGVLTKVRTSTWVIPRARARGGQTRAKDLAGAGASRAAGGGRPVTPAAALAAAGAPPASRPPLRGGDDRVDDRTT